jgi:hypothetical protein
MLVRVLQKRQRKKEMGKRGSVGRIDSCDYRG